MVFMKIKLNVFAIVLCLFSRYLFASDGALLRNSVRKPNCLQLSNSYTTH
ncbi:hypothetical protein GWK93_10845 [Vibrio parahaemolyticus]|nr:hypothetical protein [Vibrio parahaemolyticus]